MATPSSRSTTRAGTRKAHQKKGIEPGVGVTHVVDPSLIPMKLPQIWDEEEVKAEKWQAKSNYEDPEGLVPLPDPLQGQIAEWKRPTELIDRIGNATMVYEKKEEKAANPKDAAKKERRKTPETDAPNVPTIVDPAWKPTNSLSVALVSDSAFAPITSTFVALDGFKEEIFNMAGGFQQPWDLIYPKGKDGKPTINPAGKYIVKLYAFGAWRRITMDDRIPISFEGNILLPCSENKNEIWPMIITKAILKLANSFSVGITTSEPTLIPWVSGLMPSKISFPENGEKELPEQIHHLTSVAILQAPHFLQNGTHVDPFDNLPITISPGEVYAFCGFRRDEVRNRNYVKLRGAHAKGVSIQKYLIDESRPQSMTSPAGPGGLAIAQNTNAQSNTAKPSSDEADKGNLETDTSNFSYFYMTQADFLSIFTYVTIYIHPEAHTELVLDYWDDITKIYRPRQPSILHTKFDEPTVMTFLVTPAIEKYGTSVLSSTFLLEEYDWMTVNKLIIQRTQVTRAKYIDVTIPAGSRTYQLITESQRGCGYRIFCSKPFHLGEANKILSEQLGLSAHEINEEYPILHEGTWNVMLRACVRVRERALFSAQLIVVEDLLIPYIRFTFVDNDTLEETPCFLTRLPSMYLDPNQTGYTILIDTKPPHTFPSGKYKVRFLCDVKNNLVVDVIPSKTIVDLDGQAPLNKYKELFRQSVKVKDRSTVTMQLNATRTSTTVAPLIQLRVFEKGQEIRFQEARGSSTVFQVVLLPPESKAGDDRQYIIEGKYVVEYPDVDPFLIHPTIASVAAAFTPMSTTAPTNTASLTLAKDSKPDNSAAASRAINGKSPMPSSAAARSRPATPNTRRSGPSHLQIDDPGHEWHLRIVSNAPLELKKDTEREDRMAAIKDSWDKGGKLGRAAKGRAIREQFLTKVQQTMESSNLDVASPPQEPIVRVQSAEGSVTLSSHEYATKKDAIKQAADSAAQLKDGLAQSRERERKERADLMASLENEMAEWRSTLRAQRQIDTDLREQYRQRCIADKEKESEARLAAEVVE